MRRGSIPSRAHARSGARPSVTNKSDFWNPNSQLVASLQTLRLDSNDRHGRLLRAEPWDLVIVDEAHHLNADEQAGPTLGFALVQKLLESRRIRSMVFFSGTPHRGKPFGFFSLLSLLRPDYFGPKLPVADQLRRLPEIMIRNNKQNVTDLLGEPLFMEPLVESRTYSYSEAEQRFYDMLTEFIVTGKMYASSLGGRELREDGLHVFADWILLKQVNDFSPHSLDRMSAVPVASCKELIENLPKVIADCIFFAKERGSPFRYPDAKVIAILIPSTEPKNSA